MAKEMMYRDSHHSELEKIYNSLPEECTAAKGILESSQEGTVEKQDLNAVWEAVNAIVDLALPEVRVKISPLTEFEYLSFNPEKIKLLFTAQMDQNQISDSSARAVRSLFFHYDYLGHRFTKPYMNMDLIISVLFEILDNEKIPANNGLKQEYSYNLIWGEDIIKTNGYIVTQYVLKEKEGQEERQGELWFDVYRNKNELYKTKDEEIDEEKPMHDFLTGKCVNCHSTFYQMGIEQLYSKVIGKLITKGKCREKSFAGYFNSYQSFCSMLPFSETYMVEKITGLYLAVEFYMCTRRLMKYCDPNLMGRLAEVISEIESLEVRLYVAEGMQNIFTQTENWNEEQINYLLETLIKEVKKNKDFFNIYYHRAFHIMLYAFAEKEHWEKLKNLIDTKEDENKANNNLAYNRLRNFIRKISQGGINVNNNFQDLYFACDSRGKEYKWFHEIFFNIKKGEPTLYQNVEKDPAKEEEIFCNLFTPKKFCPEGIRLVEYIEE